MPMRLARAVLLFLAVSALTGCTGSGGRIPIHGVVTYKGQSLDKGVITFIPADPTQGTTEGALIADGKYAVPAEKGLQPGSYRVSISSVQQKTSVDPSAAPGAPKGARETIPDHCNANSKLTIEVSSSGTHEFDFRLD